MRLYPGLQVFAPLGSFFVTLTFFVYLVKTQPYADESDDTYSMLLHTVKLAQLLAVGLGLCLELLSTPDPLFAF